MNKGGISMAIGASIISILYLGIILAIAGLSIYALILLVKALKIYIDKNS